MWKSPVRAVTWSRSGASGRRGWTEVLGGLLYKNRQRFGMAPAFVNLDSNMSASIAHYGQPCDSLVDEVRDTERRGLTKGILVEQGVPLFSGGQKRYPGLAR